MYRKCNIHLLENCVAISDLFYKLRDTIKTEITIKTNTRRKLKPINEFSTIGEQIKYYRVLQDIKQEDLCKKLGVTREALFHIENRDMKLVDIKLLESVIKELKIEDKLIINDDYIEFLLNDPCEKIKSIRKQMNLSLVNFADMLQVSDTSVRRWENGNCHISREKYNKLKKCMS